MPEMSSEALNPDSRSFTKRLEAPIGPRDIDLGQLLNGFVEGPDSGLRIPRTAACAIRFFQIRNRWPVLFRAEKVADRFSRLIPLEFDWFVERGYFLPTRRKGRYLLSNSFIEACLAACLAATRLADPSA